jgi:hypothetical protein
MPPPRWLDVDAHGRVVPGSEEVRRTLADRAGRFALLPSSPDLVVAHRVGDSGGPGTRPRVILAGDLAGFPIADFVGFIHQSRLSGVLTVLSVGTERQVSFKDGEVRGTQSTAPGERIGEVALRLGYLTEDQLGEAAAAGRPMGKAMVDLGFVAANDLWKCFHEQVTAVFHAILLAREGVFFMVDEDVGDRPGTPLAVSTQSLLMDGIRRIDEMSLFKARIPGPRAFLRRREPRRVVTLKPVEQALLDLVDGRRAVAQLAQAAHLSEFDATKILFHLAEAGYVEASDQPAAERADPTARLEAVTRAMDGLLRLVAAAVPARYQRDFLEAVRSHLADGRAPFAPLFRRIVPRPDGTLDEGALLGNAGAIARLDPEGDVARLMADALRELLFFYLYLAGERIPREADEALAAQVKAGLARLEGLLGP